MSPTPKSLPPAYTYQKKRKPIIAALLLTFLLFSAIGLLVLSQWQGGGASAAPTMVTATDTMQFTPSPPAEALITPIDLVAHSSSEPDNGLGSP